MAFNTGDRFERPTKNYKIFEPGIYQTIDTVKIKTNKAPFLSKTERNTHPGNRIWTHAIYNTDLQKNIPNCTSMMSKRPRFPYQALSKEDLEAILCKCGVQNVCECSEESDEHAKIMCEGRKHRRLFKGHPPRSIKTEGISVPCRRDYGYEEQPNGTYKRIFSLEQVQSPPFYNANVIESTAFYRGCKWSRWKSTRSPKSLEERPGPADYTITKQPTYADICAEKVREQKRKMTKQLRFIESIQRRDISEGRPGPATYNPQYPTRKTFNLSVSKAHKFKKSIIEQGPGPSDYWIRRDFDILKPPLKPCLAKLPGPSFFGVKSNRFNLLKEVAPSPATYSPTYKHCNILHCSTAPFGSSAGRFQNTTVKENYEDHSVSQVEINNAGHTSVKCFKPTWEFKSKTVRMHSLKTKPFEQSPADVPMSSVKVVRPLQLQYMAPFYTSEGRFLPWHNGIAVATRLTPGPGAYNPEESKCFPAVRRGPLFRAKRFITVKYRAPAPNEYKVGGGIESIFTTHNQRLKKNMATHDKFIWKPRVEAKKLPLEEQENILLQKSIALLDINGDTETKLATLDAEDINFHEKPKLLRSFLYSSPVQYYS